MSLNINYSEIDKAIMELNRISGMPEEIYITLGRLQYYFSNCKSDTSAKMLEALSQYKRAYDAMLKICRNSSNMLSVAKFLYENSDSTQSQEIADLQANVSDDE